jgi:glycosyltransferase involved in cell wall biosynthesis
MQASPIKISAVIISFNEERNIEDCIKSLVDVADEIVVVDSCSTDKTKEICLQYKVNFITHAFEGYVAQKNYALTQAAYDHVLSLDADERLSVELINSIKAVKKDWGKVTGYSFSRFNNYCGQWMKYSGWYERKTRLWDKRKASWGGTDPHDTVVIHPLKTKHLKGNLIHYAYRTVDEHIQQNFRFAEIAAKAKYKKGERCNFIINVIFSPTVRFVRTYFFQLGFLDGYYGFVFCAVSSSLTFYKYLRLYEYTRKGLPESKQVI